MADRAVAALRALFAREGGALLGDARRCESLLRDLLPTGRREVAALLAALRCGVPQELLRSVGDPTAAATAARLAARLHEEEALAIESARWAVDAWSAIVLGTTSPAGRPISTPSHGGGSAARPAAELYHEAVAQAVADGVVSADEESLLGAMRASLGLSDAEAGAIRREVEIGIVSYRQAVEEIASDGRISPREESLLRKLQTSLGLTDTQAAGIRRAVAKGTSGGSSSDRAGAKPVVGIWVDPTTGYFWQNPTDGVTRSWEEAVVYARSLSLGGYRDWRLPTISELRTLIRGWPNTMTGGACRVTDDQLGEEAGTHACNGGPRGKGPGREGFYQDPALDAARSVWSSSSYSGSSSYAWYVYFDAGYVDYADKASSSDVRCIRRGP